MDADITHVMSHVQGHDTLASSLVKIADQKKLWHPGDVLLQLSLHTGSQAVE